MTQESRKKIRLLTKPKCNAEFRAKSKGLCAFMMSQNLIDLAMDKKTKQKNLAMRVVECTCYKRADK